MNLFHCLFEDKFASPNISTFKEASDLKDLQDCAGNFRLGHSFFT